MSIYPEDIFYDQLGAAVATLGMPISEHFSNIVHSPLPEVPSQAERVGAGRSVFDPEDEQMRLARLVQDILLPPPRLETVGLEVEARFLPSAKIGGDFFDYFTLGSRYLGIYLGDVQGKGLEAAMYALLISGLMRGIHKSDRMPAEVVGFLNRRLCQRGVPGKFCCLGYAVFDLAQGQLRFANAGLPFPLLIRNGTPHPIQLTGTPVGLFNSSEFEQAVVSLQPGDRLLFYTDGLPDTLRFLQPQQDDEGAQLEKLVAANQRAETPAFADGLLGHVQEARKWCPSDLADDVTYLVIHMS